MKKSLSLILAIAMVITCFAGLGLVSAAEAPVISENFSDDLSTLDNIFEKADENNLYYSTNPALGNINTIQNANEDGIAYITYKINNIKNVNVLMSTWHNSTKYKKYLNVLVSEDNTNWTPVEVTCDDTAEDDGWRTFNVTNKTDLPKNAKYVKILMCTPDETGVDKNYSLSVCGVDFTAYTKSEGGDTSSSTSSEETSSAENTKPENSSDSPVTGEDSSAVGAVLISMIAVVALAAVAFSRKKQS